MLASLMCSFIVRSLVGANVVVINSINMFNVGMIWAIRSIVPTKYVCPARSVYSTLLGSVGVLGILNPEVGLHSSSILLAVTYPRGEAVVAVCSITGVAILGHRFLVLAVFIMSPIVGLINPCILLAAIGPRLGTVSEVSPFLGGAIIGRMPQVPAVVLANRAVGPGHCWFQWRASF